jgi:hypothetical protein
MMQNALDWYRICTRVYPKVSGLAAWNENCKWYNSLPLGAVVSLFYELLSFAAIIMCVASQRVFIVVSVYFVTDSVRKLLNTPSYLWLRQPAMLVCGCFMK